MGSSYTQGLKSGAMIAWESKLRGAKILIDEVSAAIYECIGEDGQYDNAASDGGTLAELQIAKRIISELLPDAGEDEVTRLRHHRDITVGLWATDRPELMQGPEGNMFRIADCTGVKKS